MGIKFSNNIFASYIDVFLITLLTLLVMLVNSSLYLMLIIILPLTYYLLKRSHINPIIMSILMLAAIDQIPNHITVQIIVFAFCLFLVFYRLFSKASFESFKISYEGITILIFFLLIFLNAFIALNNDTNLITISEWFRGAVPFLFLIIYFPVSYTLKDHNDVFKVIVSICISAFLYALNSLYIACKYEIWKPIKWFQDETGEWIRLTSQVNIMPDNTSYFWERITIIFSKSTNELFLVGFFICIILFINFKNHWMRAGLFIMWAVITFNIIISYSRSFHIIVILGLLLLISLSIILRKYKMVLKYVFVTVFTIMFTVAIVNVLDLKPFKNRYYSLNLTFSQYKSQEFKENNNNLPKKDSNVVARLDEAKIAYGLFRERPLLGHGLGVKHKIKYDIGFGKVKTFSKAYIHNSALYFSMTMGLFGLISYIAIYCVAIWGIVKSWKKQSLLCSILATSIFAISLYSQVFAVFRLIDFNVLLGTLLGIVHVIGNLQKKETI